MSETTLDWEQLSSMDGRKRAQLVNSLSGVKSANVIGTQDDEGHLNCAIVTSVIHLGSDPALLGHVMRPPTGREHGSHTYHNIKATGQYTINHVGADWYRAAHQTSARYPAQVSEFEAVGLRPVHRCGFEAPAVEEAKVSMGMEFLNEMELPNGCKFIVGSLRWVTFDGSFWAEDGALNLAGMGVIAVTGLDGYHALSPLERLTYAKPNQALGASADFLQSPKEPSKADPS
jgi:flavin reductase (DIM6/NTAB) family NADH-FMN oxidoreductase RutF